ncbi:lysin B [Gordonia phage Hexbug]|nr:lysin B [Gordonia phage Orla]UVK62967.1 lysin B [Gordonia phage Hexbug]
MPTTYIVGVRGTSELDHQPLPNVPLPMLRKVHRHAEAGRLRSSDNHYVYVEVSYPASIGFVNARRDLFGAALHASLNEGAAALLATVRIIVGKMMRGDKLIVMGYSLGALVVIKAYNDSRGELAAVTRFVLMASPACSHMRPWGAIANVTRTGKRYTGIASEWVNDAALSTDTRAFHVAHPRDPIALLHPSSPMRYAVPALWELDLDDPKAIDNAIRMVKQGKVAGIITRLFDPEYRDAAAEAGNDLIRYIHGGFHTARYSFDYLLTGSQSPLSVAVRLVSEA